MTGWGIIRERHVSVEKVMEDRGAYRENASRYVKEIYGWKKVMEEWEEVIDGVIG